MTIGEESLKRFLAGYNFSLWTPQTRGQRLLRALHELFHAHKRSRSGSWCFGYDFICDDCGMAVGPWTPERCQRAADAINALPESQQGQAAAQITGGK